MTCTSFTQSTYNFLFNNILCITGVFPWLWGGSGRLVGREKERVNRVNGQWEGKNKKKTSEKYI